MLGVYEVYGVALGELLLPYEVNDGQYERAAPDAAGNRPGHALPAKRRGPIMP